MKKLFLFLLICGLSLASFSQINTKTEKIHKMLELTGSGKLGVQVAQKLLASFKQSFTNVDSTVWKEFAKEIKPEDLIDLIVPIYDKYYTEQDIDDMIVFYNTPVGKKMIASLPAITQESMMAGQFWGQKIGEKVISRLKEKGYLKTNK